MRSLPFLLCIALAACGGKQSTPATTTDEPTGTTERIASTGPLSEEEFKALHTLRDEAAPPPRGTEIDLAGSRAYLSLPEGATAPVPGIIVIHEWWGLNEHIQHWADRLASLGYAALAVDLYGGVVATDRDTAMATMQKVDEAEARRILAAAVDFLGADPRVQAPRHGVIGWCFGGAWSLEAAIDNPEIDAAVIYYGHVDTDPKRLARIEAEVLGIFGTQDTGIPPEHVAAFASALLEAEVESTIRSYDAEHAFGNPSSDRYDEEDAAAAWDEVVGFLGRTLQ